MNPWDDVPVIDITGRMERIDAAFFLELDPDPGLPTRRVTVTDRDGTVLHVVELFADDAGAIVIVRDPDGGIRNSQRARNYGTDLFDLVARRTCAMLLVEFVDLGGFEVLYLFDTADRDFGYALNLDIPDFSEWGHAPVRWPPDRPILAAPQIPTSTSKQETA